MCVCDYLIGFQRAWRGPGGGGNNNFVLILLVLATPQAAYITIGSPSENSSVHLVDMILTADSFDDSSLESQVTFNFIITNVLKYELDLLFIARCCEIVSSHSSTGWGSTLQPVSTNWSCIFRFKLPEMSPKTRPTDDNHFADLCRHETMESSHSAFHQVLHSAGADFNTCPIFSPRGECLIPSVSGTFFPFSSTGVWT